nr:superoxide dismutase family protein [Actinomadura rayongensis]
MVNLFVKAASVAALALPLCPAAASAAEHGATTVHGPSYVYDTAYSAARTTVSVRSLHGWTIVALKVAGLPAAAAGKTFGAHVHVNPCGADPAAAGEHYHSPDAPAGVPHRFAEIWLDVTVGRGGTGRSVAAVPWTIKPGAAGSVVVHAKPTDPDTGDAGARLLCTTVPFGS